MLGGVEGQKQPLANLVGEAVAGVGDGDFDRRAIFAERAVHAEHAQQAALHGLGGIVDEVGQRAANGLRIGQHQRQAGLQIALHGDAVEPAGEQRQRLLGHLVHVAGARLRRGKLRQRGELIDQRAQRAHAAQNDLAAFADDVGRIGLAAVEMAADALGGERDGRERVLDLVGHALRHFLPRQLPLRAQQLGGVFNHQHGAGSGREPDRAARW